MKTPMSPGQVKEHLTGPVSSIPTSFLPDGEIDWDGVANVIEIAIEGGSGVILLTAGDSQYFFLTEDEIARLTRFVIERVGGRAMTVAATGAWSTRQSVEFAGFCREVGADVLMSLAPQHDQNAEGLAQHYRVLARIMSVMIVGCPPHSVLDRLLEEPAVCCFKEDGTQEYAVRTIQKYGERWRFMTGGTLGRHLAQWPFGCRSFMDWSTSFRPEVGARFWQALQAGDLCPAARVVREVEMPLFELAGAEGGKGFPGGWQGLWRAALELNGVASRYLRLPQSSASDEDLERIRPVLDGLGLLSQR